MLPGKPAGEPRWARGQKFTLSAAGANAREIYQAALVSARGMSRAALDAALVGWAAPFQVEPGDGMFLGEFQDKPHGLTDLTHALEGAGTTAAEVRAAIARLVKAGLVDPVPLASREPAAAAPPRSPRWP